MSQETVIARQKIVIKRIFAAPVERVYQAWTDPAQMACWYVPNDRWKRCDVDVDPRPGGRCNATWSHTDGDVLHLVGNYVEVVPNARISFTWTPLENRADLENTLVTVEFRAVPEGTELTLTHDRQTNPETLQGTSLGWTGCLDMLESYLDGKPLLCGAL